MSPHGSSELAILFWNMHRFLIIGILTSLSLAQTSQNAVPNASGGVAGPEREALVSLYQATDGSHWHRNEKWLGPEGTECHWQGVLCDPSSEGSMVVVSLDLGDNNLVGSVPQTLGQLKHLERLAIYRNHLAGLLPQSLIQRWLSGQLDISAEEPLLTDVSEIDFEYSASALLCARHRILLSADRSASLFTKRCRNATPKDRTTFCEVKRGHIWRGEFSKLTWVLEGSSFYTLEGEYSGNVTDADFQSTRVTRHGKTYEVVNYADAGPLTLWTVQRAIEGVGASVEWEKTSTRSECPRWSKSQK